MNKPVAGGADNISCEPVRKRKKITGRKTEKGTNTGFHRVIADSGDKKTFTFREGLKHTVSFFAQQLDRNSGSNRPRHAAA